jgi:hypothetical protein
MVMARAKKSAMLQKEMKDRSKGRKYKRVSVRGLLQETLTAK